MSKQFIKTIFRSFGYVVKRSPVDNIEENLSSLFKVLDINCVLDVGAHFGEYGHRLRSIGYKNRIVSFEPVKASYEILSQRAHADGNWLAHNFALGGANSTAEINIPTGSVLASFLEPSAYSKAEFGSFSAVERKELVKVATLDSTFDMCTEGIGSPRVFLKMDTQGFDLEVLRGAGEKTKRILGLQSEVSVKKIYEEMPDWISAIGVYTSLGYEITGLYPVNRDKDMLVIEFDCVLRKRA